VDERASPVVLNRRSCRDRRIDGEEPAAEMCDDIPRIGHRIVPPIDFDLD
jgi:hypothetical protein